jgi:hypothetical protein
MTMTNQTQGKEAKYITRRKRAGQATPIWGSPHIGHYHLHAVTGKNYHPGVGQS